MAHTIKEPHCLPFFIFSVEAGYWVYSLYTMYSTWFNVLSYPGKNKPLEGHLWLEQIIQNWLKWRFSKPSNYRPSVTVCTFRQQNSLPEASCLLMLFWMASLLTHFCFLNLIFLQWSLLCCICFFSVLILWRQAPIPVFKVLAKDRLLYSLKPLWDFHKFIKSTFTL